MPGDVTLTVLQPAGPWPSWRWVEINNDDVPAPARTGFVPFPLTEEYDMDERLDMTPTG